MNNNGKGFQNNGYNGHGQNNARPVKNIITVKGHKKTVELFRSWLTKVSGVLVPPNENIGVKAPDGDKLILHAWRTNYVGTPEVARTLSKNCKTIITYASVNSDGRTGVTVYKFFRGICVYRRTPKDNSAAAFKLAEKFGK